MLKIVMAMWPILALIALLVVVLGVIELLKQARKRGPGAGDGSKRVAEEARREATPPEEVPEDKVLTFPYVRKGAFLSAAELAFYRVLVAAAGPGGVVMAQVVLTAILEVDVPRGERGGGGGAGAAQTARNRIDRKVVDFVVCEAGTMRVLAAVELDDRSHARADRVKRDAVVEGALKAAGVPLVRVPWANSYDPGAIRRRLQEAGVW